MHRCAKGDRNGRGNRGGSPRPDSARARCGSGAASDGLGRRGLDGPIGTGSRRPAGRVFLVPETWEGSRGAPARRGPLAFPGATGPRGRRSRLAGEIPRRAGRGGSDRPAGPRPVRSGHPRVSEAGCGCCAACVRGMPVIAKERDYVRLIVRANTGMARLARRRGDTKEVWKWSEAGLAIARARAEKADAVTPLHMLAAAARVDGDIGQARQFYREDLGLNRELGRLDVVSVELGNLGALEALEGNISEAVPFLRESLEIAYNRGDRYLAPYELVWLGRVASAQGSPARGATLFAGAEAQFDSTGLGMDPDEGPEYEKGLAAIRAALDEKAFSAAWATGKKMSLDEAVAFALGPSK